MKKLILAVFAAVSVLTCHAADPILYLSMDRGTGLSGSLSSETGATAVLPGEATVQPGRRREGRMIASDCLLPAGEQFPVKEGTLAFWICPAWSGNDATTHSLFNLYGKGRTDAPGYLCDRWNIYASRGMLSCSISPEAPNAAKLAASTPISDWKAGAWYHIAVTWTGINNGEDNASLRLYVDGIEKAKAGPVRLSVWQVGERMGVGRDMDASPDYAGAVYDDVYLYANALSTEQIRYAVEHAEDAATSARRDAASTLCAVPDWKDSAKRFRSRISVDLTGLESGIDAIVKLPLDLQNDLVALGLRDMLNPGSLVLYTQEGAPVPFRLEDGVLYWNWPVPAPVRTGFWKKLGKLLTRKAEQPDTGFVLYFDAAPLDFSIPLLARSVPLSERNDVPVVIADYASQAYGDSWDFDEGDFEGIDQWGDKDYGSQNQKVVNGILEFDAFTDGYFIWGDIWGQLEKPGRPFAVDVDRYPVLEMRIRQSVPSSEWRVFGKFGKNLASKEFPVVGSNWQTVSVDLKEYCHWSGIMTALRIDPTEKIGKAHIEIDWIRLVTQRTATRTPVDVCPFAVPAVEEVTVAVESSGTAGETIPVQVLATDAGGKPVPGCPLRLSLVTTGNGDLRATSDAPSLELENGDRRLVTGPDGTAAAVLRVSPDAGRNRDRVQAVAEFAKVPAAEAVVTSVPGSPASLLVSPDKPRIFMEDDLPIRIGIQVVDACRNPLPVSGRVVTLTAEPDASLSVTSVTTDAKGHAAVDLTLDMNKRWTCRVTAKEANGLEGVSGALSVNPMSQPPANTVIHLLPNGYFADAEGKPYVPLGGFYTNWVHDPTDDGEWNSRIPFHGTTEAQKRAWMQYLVDNGVTGMRFMLRTHHFDGSGLSEALDIGGRVNRRLYADVLDYLSLSREYGLLFLLVVHDDYHKPVYHYEKFFRAYTLPEFADERAEDLPPFQRRFVKEARLLPFAKDKYTDPDAMKCQDMYAQELSGYLKYNPCLFAYELENEMVRCPAAWANHAIAALKSRDPKRLVCVSHGGGSLKSGDPLFWHEKTDIDFYTYHIYATPGTTGPGLDYGTAVDLLTRYGRMAGPCFLGESSGDGFTQMLDQPERRRWIMRDIIWLSLTNGNPGCFFWNARGSEITEFAIAKKAMAMLDTTRLQRIKPEIGIDVTHPLEDDMYYQDTEEGKADYDMMGRYAMHYIQQGVDFDFTTRPGDYAKSADLKTFAPPAPSQCPVRPSAGVQTTYLADQDWREGLIYVRNFNAIVPWEFERNRNSRTYMIQMHLRERKAVPTAVALDLPEGQYQLTIFDLDTRSEITSRTAQDGSVDLGTTDHDFAIVFHRK